MADLTPLYAESTDHGATSTIKMRASVFRTQMQRRAAKTRADACIDTEAISFRTTWNMTN
jgi:hypothetical protein